MAKIAVSSAIRHIRIILHGKEAQNIAVRDAVRLLRSERCKIDVRVTWEEGDARRLAREARQLGVDTVVAAGGDGTLNEVVNGLMAADNRLRMPSLGVIPLGTANDFAHACRIPLAPLEALLLIAELPAVPIDLAKADSRYFINMATGGFGTQITTSTPEELKRALGGVAYFLTGMTQFTSISAVEGEVKAPDFHWQGAFMVLGVGNGRQAGGGHELCPDACLDDGLLDLSILPQDDQRSLAETVQYLMLDGGTALQHAMVTKRVPWLEIRARQLLNINLDGEPISGQCVRFEVCPSALGLHLPRHSPVLQKNVGLVDRL
ncbi:lipid kinase YegS [Oceanospirillum beijerinckii]|uniref:lipid kinase YegS n=1 Tax=Oceanospirillum beijerinckii TaxID=64976 RepID=UPI00040E3F2A|nr:lipid kinase YegS [Oceanospirillum beijerinckii]